MQCNDDNLPLKIGIYNEIYRYILYIDIYFI